MKLLKYMLAVFLIISTVVHCDDNDDEKPTGTFKVTLSNTGEVYQAVKSGAFTTPVGASEPAPIGPGGAYEFSFAAPPGARLSLATMFVQSNDWIYASGEEGIPLYNQDGSKNTGDVTAMIDLYDAGTEMDQEAGTGSNQAPRQDSPATGPEDSNSNVRQVNKSDLPSDEEVIKVTISSNSTYGFTVRIENVSTSNTLETSEGSKAVPLSPGVFAVHHASESALLFETGQPDYGEGLEDIAEDGMPSMLAEHLGSITGITPVYAPGAYAVYEGENPLFMSGSSATGNGLEAMAEDGMPGMLKASLDETDRVHTSGVFNTPSGSQDPGPLTPGSSYSFTFEAEEGTKLSFATMYVHSNDWFYAPVETGLSLFENGTPNTGSFTDQVHLWDSGTEANEEPGIGANQAPRQSDVDTGPADPNSNVRRVGNEFPYMKNLEVEIEMVQN